MKYEFMAIIKPFLPEDVRAKLQKSIKAIFEKRGGNVLSEDVWGKRHLAYKIKGHEEGYYVLYDLDLPRAKYEEINRDLGLINDLLRYIIIKKDS